MKVMIIQADVTDESVCQHLPSGLIYLALYIANCNHPNEQLAEQKKAMGYQLPHRQVHTDCFDSHPNGTRLNASNSISER